MTTKSAVEGGKPAAGAKLVVGPEAPKPMTKEKEKLLRGRASEKDMTAEFMRMMLATIDSQRATLASALAIVDATAPKCWWPECKDLATRVETGDETLACKLCDKHTRDNPTEDLPWGASASLLTALIRASTENDKPKA